MSESTTAVIIGSTSGIGLGIARSLDASGANIILNGMETVDEVQELISQIQNERHIKVNDCNANLMKGEGV